jgi:transposase-like protein
MTKKRELVTHMQRIRRRYTLEFKLEAVRQFEQGDKSLSRLGLELDIRPPLLYYWHRQKLLGRLNPESLQVEPELRRLKQALRRVTQERDTLKKAISYFGSPRS